ncbi:bifunctional glycosyltransferase/CDP-glycerol:glycerophosphate glycerophosphotransferase [Clostridium sardiniense]|uniref:bifunctional glycosyltransferase/CDP-glycerol:glycerophosphate glycerophosphotransferase n=1 Tax=Clostridium sardiniense TaxID=29369 RepID=UPI003D32AB0D
MNSKYKVSVIMPVYNVEEYLKETLDSLVVQTLDDVEVILIDDGSTDNSKAIIEEYASKHSNIVGVYQKNSGPSKARNKGIELAQGEFIAFMDSDDLIPKDSLEVRYNLAVNNDSDVIVCGTCKYDGSKLWPMVKHFLSEGPKDIREDYDLLWTLGPCNKLFRTSLIKELRFPETIKYAEDQVFVMSAYLRARKIYATKYVAYFYRMRNNPTESLTQQIHTASGSVIKQVCDSWSRTKEEIDRNIKNKYIASGLKYAYISRLVSVDIWPPFKRAIISRNESVQLEAITNMENLLDAVDDNIFNDLSTFKWIVIKGVIDKYLFLSAKARTKYIDLLIKGYNKLNTNSRYILAVENKYLINYVEKAVRKHSKYYIYKYLTRRKIENLPEKIKKTSKKYVRISFRLSKLMPIKKNKVILASNKSNRLSGNLKFINDELVKKSKYDIKVYMDRNNRTLWELIKMYYNFATAKYIILDDYHRQLYGLKFKPEAEVVQVWHACGAFKKFGFSSVGKGDGNTAEFEQRAHGHYTKVITSSKNINKHYAEAFNIDESNVIPLGVPRTDILFDTDYRDFIRNKLESEHPIIRGKKIITYAPTFRGSPKERQNFKLELDPVKILKEVGEDYVIIFKLHPSVKNGLGNVITIPKEFKNRIINLNSNTDINDLIMVTEILISDYSSVIFEGALLDKKMILFAYDKESYLAERDFYYEYDEFVPGPIAYTNNDIIKIINEDKFDATKVSEFKKEFFDHADGKSSERFVEYIFNEK